MGNEKSVMGVVGANISANFRMGLGPMNEEVGVEIGGLLDADLAFGIGGGTTIGPSLEAGIQGGKSRWSTLDQPLLSMVRTSLRGGVAAEFHRDARVGVRLRALVGADFVHVSGRRFSTKPEFPDRLFAEPIGPTWQTPALSTSVSVLCVFHVANDANIVVGAALTLGPGAGRDDLAVWQDMILGVEWPF